MEPPLEGPLRHAEKETEGFATAEGEKVKSLWI